VDIAEADKSQWVARVLPSGSPLDGLFAFGADFRGARRALASAVRLPSSRWLPSPRSQDWDDKRSCSRPPAAGRRFGAGACPSIWRNCRHSLRLITVMVGGQRSPWPGPQRRAFGCGVPRCLFRKLPRIGTGRRRRGHRALYLPHCAGSRAAGGDLPRCGRRGRWEHERGGS